MNPTPLLTSQTKLNFASLGDIHFDHPNTPTAHIVKGLYKAFPDNETTAALDVIFFEGDIWHKLVNYNSETVGEVRRFFLYLFRLCAKYNIVIRSVEGTGIHDWKQSFDLVELNRDLKTKADFRHVADVEIEYHAGLGIHILYIPDEFRTDANETWKIVRERMLLKNLDQVDFILMHGMFHHQAPDVIKHHINIHDLDKYSSIVRFFIMIGHFHLMSRMGKCLAAGSFDRISQGEESPKGHFRGIVHVNGECEAYFIENAHAKLYITIPCHGLKETLNKHIESYLVKYPDAEFRIRAYKNDDAIVNSKIVAARYPIYNFAFKADDNPDIAKQKKEILEQVNNVVRVNLDEDTLRTLMAERLKGKFPQQSELCLKLLEGVLRA